MAFVFGLAFALFAGKRLLRFLQFFQQEEYQNSRFWRWCVAHRTFDRRGTAIAVLAGVNAWLFAPSCIPSLAGAAALGILAVREEDPRGTGKISLKLTARAKRILLVAIGIAVAVLIVVLGLLAGSPGWLVWLAAVPFFQLLPLCLMAAKVSLDPDERRRQNEFLQEAKDNLARVNPYVIGITGSFGKTSVKALLGELLEVALGPTFWPPKSINTPMGVTRELRERLKPGHKYAVTEMGAYNVGSVERLCALTPPKAAIVTAVGLMHLERFGSQENIYLAKSELPRAIPADGILVCNGDNPGARKMATEFKKKTTLVYGLDQTAGPLDCWITDITLTPAGTTFVIHLKDSTYRAKTKMFGRPALSNILAAFTMATALGADPSFVAAAIANLEPFDNRLEVKRVGGFLQINDAYNSNPDGFRAALDVLRELPGGKKILMTPGMIELGDRQAPENQAIGEYAAKICDHVIVVAETNREAIVAGLRAGGLSAEQITTTPTRAAAFEALEKLRTIEDVTLIENDLPDLYEPKFVL